MKLKEGVSLDVTDARWVSRYVLDITFSDGFCHKVDFEPFLTASLQPDVRRYLDVEKFKALPLSTYNTRKISRTVSIAKLTVPLLISRAESDGRDGNGTNFTARPRNGV